MPKSKPIGGLRLKLAIVESNLDAKARELDRLREAYIEVASERDFLRKVVTNLSEHRRF